MVGMMSPISRERIASLLNSAKYVPDIRTKLHVLRQLKDELSDADSPLLSEFLPPLLDLVSDRFSPVRKLTIEIIGYIGFKHGEFLPDIVPVLISALKDDTPAVARQAITCGIDIFRCTLVKVAIQGLFSSELDDSLVSAWAWVLKFRDAIYTMAFQPASDGRTLLALKFVESVVLLYTADPSVSSELPPALDIEGKFEQFNVSWLRGGHPVLNVGDLAVEASQSLGLLLDQLRFPAVKSITNLMIIVLINCLSAIATKRPAFYGRILPVLFSLDPSSSDSNGKHVSGVHHALKNAFVSCLNCTHPGAAPWRDRLEGALREKKGGIPAEEASNQVCENNGHIEMKDVSSISEDSKLSMKALDAGQSITGTKRSGAEDNAELADDNPSKKRIRSAPTVSEAKKHESSGNQERVSTGGSTTTKTDVDSDAVQQLIGMFSAIVAQGDKAVVSLEILIPSIAADSLADVVMANMRNLPPYQPNVDNDEDPRMKPENESDFKRLSSLLTDILSQSSTLEQKDEGDAQSLVSIELEQGGEEHLDLVNTDATPDDVNYTSEQAPEYVTETLTSSKSTPPTMVDDVAEVPSEVTDFGNMENFIPGLDSVACKDESSELVVLSSVDPSELEDGGQEQVSSLVRSPLEVVPSVSTDRSEELSPKAAVTDVTSMNSSTSTSFGLSPQLLLPKMAAPVINLSDEQNDNLQTSAFSRVIDAYKQVTAAGGSQVRFSILANLGVEFPSELNPWKFLQTHILSDYINHEGHELTLRVLYRLYGRAEEDQDFLSSTAATSVYETFLLTVAETLKDSFPASDKSLSRLLGEAPYLPKSILKMLESFCCPGSSEKDEKELHSGDRVTQGLSTVWNLILLRPPIREACLRIALQSAVHHLEEVRMKAIRLVANKLYPLSSISQQIELFANENLLSVSNVGIKADSNGDGSNPELQKDFAMEKPSEEEPLVSVTTKDASDTLQSSTSESVSAFSIAEGQRCMSLYFALCTKKHSLFAQIFVVYGGASQAVKQAMHQQIPMLVRTIGTSSELLEIISDPPSGSDKLLMQVLQTLTEGTVPSLQLIATIRKLYETKVKDVELLIMILPSLSKEEVLLLFPHIVNVPLDKFQGALSRVLQGSAQSGPLLTPAEALIAIHGIDPERDGIPLKKVTDACNACFEQREIFSQQVLAKVLNQLVEQIPLPLLFMRTVIQTIGAFPSLVEFIMDILSRLVNKQIWKYPKQWVGFVKCAHLTKPQSFSVLLQLPPAQLENALSRTPGLRAPLVAHATQPHIKSSLPRSVLTVLGIASDAQVSSQAHPIQSQTANTGNSDKEAVTETTRESSIAN